MDKTHETAFNASAPEGERRDAMAQLQREYLPGVSDLLAQDAIQSFAEEVRLRYMEEAAFFKSSPRIDISDEDRGMRWPGVEEWLFAQAGGYYERPGLLSFDAMRAMVEQTPVLNAVVMTRVRQVQRFCRPAGSDNDLPGFAIRHLGHDHRIGDAEEETMAYLTRFFANCGWEWKPRRRKALGRDAFPAFMAKLVRDSLTFDSVAIETEWKNDRSLGFDGLYAVDGGTIRLCGENGFLGDEDIFAVQVVNGRVVTEYTHDDLIYEPRNPRSDVRSCGYGLSETELLIRVVTGFLNAMTYNIKGFDTNAIPKGILHLTGNYSDKDLNAFKRYWTAMVKGVDNAWSMPIMTSKDQDSKVSFERFGIEFDEMYFSKWMTFLTSIICAIYGMSPAEINFDSFTAGNTSALSGSDTAEKLAASKDSGLRPLLAYFETLFTDYVCAEFSDRYVFRWTGLDPVDAARKDETKRLLLTVNELRAMEGYRPMEGPVGDAPLNPSLISVWMQTNGAESPDTSDEMPDISDLVGKQQSGDGKLAQAEQESAGGDFGKAFVPIYKVL